ncbi:MAG: hypothetical protein RIA65_13040 [Woeseia sp.]
MADDPALWLILRLALQNGLAHFPCLTLKPQVSIVRVAHLNNGYSELQNVRGTGGTGWGTMPPGFFKIM